jgi:DNA-binding MarR family transcriptional regulator
MNAIFFGCKRAFQSCLRITRPWITHLGLTSARFDMLTAISRFPIGPFQRQLREMLGVSRATISRMLISLEELGLIQRRRSDVDRRQLHVTLTAAGMTRLRRATAAFIDSGAAQLAVDSALTQGRVYDESLCFTQMDTTEGILRLIRDAFRDVARLHYPWHPDD